MRVFPSKAILELTTRCNQACLFCYCPWIARSAMVGPEITIGEWTRVVDELVAHGVRSFTLSGGEASLKEGVRDLILHLAAIPETLYVEVFSNGLAIDDAWLDFLSVHHVRLDVSLPSLGHFGELTGCARKGKEILSLIERATDRGLEVVVSVAVTAPAFGELRKIIASAFVAGARSVQIGPVMPEGRCHEHPEFLLTPDQVAALPRIAAGLSRLFGQRVDAGTEAFCTCRAADGRMAWREDCNAGRDFLVVGPDGFVRPCLHMDRPVCRWPDLVRIPSQRV